MRDTDTITANGSHSSSPGRPPLTANYTFIPEDSMANEIQDAVSAPPTTSLTSGGTKFRPYASSNHHVTKGRYITSNDPRGYIPVYEYPLNGQWIMMDIDDGYILWTGIWKALGNSKADIVKMIDSQPDLAAQIRRVRGGYLKIQGTWMPYEVALRLSRRVAWPIRDDLVPLFGPTFPSTCLSPDQPGYGQVVASAPGRRRARRAANSNLPGSNPTPSTSSTQQGWTVITAPTSQGKAAGPHQSHPHYSQFTQVPDPYPVHTDLPSSRERGNSRFAPYPLSTISPALSGTKPPSPRRGSSTDFPMSSPLSPHPHSRLHPEIVLPPIERDPSSLPSIGGSSYALPPISALEDLRGLDAHDSAAVLRRLKGPDDPREPYSRLGSPAMSSSGHHHTHSAGYPSSSWPPPQYAAEHPSTSAIPRYPSDPSMRSTKPIQHTLRSYESRDSVRSKLSVSMRSDSSCAPSPVSPPSPSTPATPHSFISNLPSPKDPRDYAYPVHQSSFTSHGQNFADLRRDSYSNESFSRQSSESNTRQPHRPW